MAFTEKTAFEARLTNNENDILSHVAGKYIDPNNNSNYADCDAGQLVVRNANGSQKVLCEGFESANVYNDNTWVMVDASASANVDTPVFACDTYDTQLIGSGENNYFIGARTLGLGVPAGRCGNFTRINFDGQSIYRFGEGNFSAFPDKQFATIANGKLVPTASAPATAGAIYFQIVNGGVFVEGTSDSFRYFDVIAKRVTVAG